MVQPASAARSAKNDCAVCDYTVACTVCSRCANVKFLRGGACVDAYRPGEQAVGEEDRDGRECVE